jgi:beta-D-galactosyl-(1->4)-L-rhamnose phosphorylase
VAPFKVAVLTAWGRLRSWICNGHFIHGLALNELLESLAGLPVDVKFLSFDDILKCGIPADVRVIINCGQAGSAWCGGEHWKNTAILKTIIGWVADGNGFIGIEEPSACEHTNRYFQLADVLGVDREIGRTLSKPKMPYTTNPQHFILKDTDGAPDLGKGAENIFLVDKDTHVLTEQNGSPQIAVHNFHAGRSLYLSAYTHTLLNTRLIHRALYWIAGAEADFGPWTCSDIRAECAYYAVSGAENGTLIVINNSDVPVETDIYTLQQQNHSASLEPHGMCVLTV